MKLEDMILVSVDDHVVEPPHLFEGRLPAKYRDRAPHVVHVGPEGLAHVGDLVDERDLGGQEGVGADLHQLGGR